MPARISIPEIAVRPWPRSFRLPTSARRRARSARPLRARRRERHAVRRASSRTRAAGRCATCASRSPTAATSAASTACRRRSSARDYAFLPHAELLTFEEIARLARDLRRPRRREDPPHRRRAAAAPQPRAAGRDARAMLGDIDLTLTTNGSLLAQQGARPARRGPDAHHGQPRLARRRDVPRDERRRLSRSRRVLEGIDAAAAAGLAPIKVNMVVKRGVNEDVDRADGAPLPRQRPHRALHRVHGRRRDQRLAHGRRRAGRARSSPRSTRELPLEPADAELHAAKSPSAGATATAAARSA